MDKTIEILQTLLNNLIQRLHNSYNIAVEEYQRELEYIVHSVSDVTSKIDSLLSLSLILISELREVGCEDAGKYNLELAQIDSRYSW